DTEFVIGWTGTSGNFQYFDLVEPALAHFFDKHDDARMMVVADRAPDFRLISGKHVTFIPWTPESEAQVLHQMTVGIMPLSDTPWARGKCSFKLLQYMASGLPVIASPVGMNADVLAKGEVGFSAISVDDWYNALHMLYMDSDAVARLGNN